jgi:hypothetical protein
LLHGPVLDRVGFAIGGSCRDLHRPFIVERIYELVASVAMHVTLEVLANVALVRLGSPALFVPRLVRVSAVEWDVPLIAGDVPCAASSAGGEVTALWGDSRSVRVTSVARIASVKAEIGLVQRQTYVIRDYFDTFVGFIKINMSSECGIRRFGCAR